MQQIRIEMRVLNIPFSKTFKGHCLFRIGAPVACLLSLLDIEIPVSAVRLPLPTVLQRTDV